MDIPFLEHVCNAPAPDARSVRSNAARGSAENDDSRRNGPLKRDAFKGNPLWNITLSSKEFSMPVAYITGATSGIGRATAERFIEEGWTVVAMARREERLQVKTRIPAASTASSWMCGTRRLSNRFSPRQRSVSARPTSS